MRSTLRLTRTGLACLLFAALTQAQTKPAAPPTAKMPEKAAEPKAEMEANPVVLMKTSMGDIRIELMKKEAPISTENFLTYVDDGFYDGTIYHRVIPTFMIQGGGFTAAMEQKTTRATIKNEAGNGVKNSRGTLAMARLPTPDSASSQFFINVTDNAFLDHRDDTQAGYGYAVFGKVIAGMDVVDKIKAVATGTKGPYGDVPVTPVVIQSVKRESK